MLGLDELLVKLELLLLDFELDDEELQHLQLGIVTVVAGNVGSVMASPRHRDTCGVDAARAVTSRRGQNRRATVNLLNDPFARVVVVHNQTGHLEFRA